MRHFFQQNATWQIDRDGVLFLQRYGIGLGEKFTTDLFMQLWLRGMVYTGSRPPTRVRKPGGATLSPNDLALRERAARLYKALYNGKLEEAIEFIVPPIRRRKTLIQFRTDLMRAGCFRLVAWKIQCLGSEPFQSEWLPDATRSGWINVDLEVEDESGTRNKIDAQDEFWLQIKGEWYWMGSGRQRKNAPVEA